MVVSKESVAYAAGAAVAIGVGAAVINRLSKEKHEKVAFDGEECHFTLPAQPHPLFLDFVVNQQGLRLFTRTWEAAAGCEAKGTVLVVHGFAEHCGRYGVLAAALSARGYRVVAYDHQGHGRSEGDRAHVERFAHYVDDLLDVARVACGEEGPLFVVAHSMGAQVAIHAAASHKIPNLRGVALSAPAVEPDPEMATPLLVFLARRLSSLLPKVPLDPLPSKFLSRDKTVVEQYLNDPLVYKGGVRARFACEMLDAMAKCFSLARTQTEKVPLLLLHGGADKVIDPHGSAKLFAAWAGDKRFELLPGEFHEIFNEPSRETAFAHVADFLDAYA